MYIIDMYVRYSSGTYICYTKDYVHVANIINKQQDTFNHIGKLWLSHITQDWQNINDIINILFNEMSIPKEQKTIFVLDYKEFLLYLCEHGYVDCNESAVAYRKTINHRLALKNEYKLNILTIEITEVCNERCVHCYIPNDIKNIGIRMKLEMYKALVSDFAANGGKIVRLTGGEILTHPDLKKMIEYNRHMNLSTELSSNLSCINHDMLDYFLETVSHIQVSLYSTISTTHDEITGVHGSYEKTIDAIQYLQERGMKISIATPILKKNQNDIIKILEFAKKRMMKVALEPIITAELNGQKKNLVQRLTLREINLLLTRIAKYSIIEYENQFLRQQYQDINSPSYDFLEFLLRPICNVGRNSISVSAKGVFTPCVAWHENPLGHFNKNNINEIFHSNELESLRSIREYSFQKQCVFCDAKEFCIRCMKRNSYEKGEKFYNPEFFCQVYKMMKKIYDKYSKI